MSLRDLISFAIEASLFGLVMSMGLQSRWSDLIEGFRHPRALLGALIAVNVIVPAVALVLCLALHLSPWTEAGIMMMAISPLAPFAPIKMIRIGAQNSYVIGTFIAGCVATVFIVPLTAALLTPFTRGAVVIPVPLVGAYVLTTVLWPLLMGIAFRAQWPRAADAIAPVLRKCALAILLPIILLILARQGRECLALMGDGAFAVMAAVVTSGLVAGYALGGPDQNNRRALAQAAATRHPGLAATIAQLHSNDSRIVSAIVLYLVASIIVSNIFERIVAFRPRELRRASGAADP